MKMIIKGFVFGLFALSLSSVTLAVDKGSKEGAQAIVEAAVAFHKANGKEKTIAEGNSPTSRFRKGVMYLFALDKEGVNLIHSNPKIIGKNLINVPDSDHFLFAPAMIKAGDSKEGKGWVKYKWPNAESNVVEPKASYVQKYEDVYYACGYYL